MTALRAAAETAVRQCLGLESGESCAVVTDDDRAPIGEAIYEVASEITDDAVIVRYPPGETHGGEPPLRWRRRWPRPTSSSRRRPRA